MNDSTGMMVEASFAAIVAAFCREFSGSETSGRRTAKHNHAVGGMPDSAHLFGLARDVVYDTKPTEDQTHAFLSQRGVMVIREGDHDHLQPVGWKAWITARPNMIPKVG